MRNQVTMINETTRRKLVKAWKQAKFDSPLSDTVKDKKYAYVSPLRPLSSVSNLNGIVVDVDYIGVIFTDELISDEQAQHLTLMLITSKDEISENNN